MTALPGFFTALDQTQMSQKHLTCENYSQSKCWTLSQYEDVRAHKEIWISYTQFQHTDNISNVMNQQEYLLPAVLHLSAPSLFSPFHQTLLPLQPFRPQKFCPPVSRPLRSSLSPKFTQHQLIAWRWLYVCAPAGPSILSCGCCVACVSAPWAAHSQLKGSTVQCQAMSGYILVASGKDRWMRCSRGVRSVCHRFGLRLLCCSFLWVESSRWLWCLATVSKSII